MREEGEGGREGRGRFITGKVPTLVTSDYGVGQWHTMKQSGWALMSHGRIPGRGEFG